MEQVEMHSSAAFTAWTDSQLGILNNVSKVSSVVGLFGSSLIVMLYLRTPSSLILSHHVVLLCLSLCEIIVASGYLIGTWSFQSEVLCQAQGTLIQLGLSAGLYHVALATDMFLKIVVGYTDEMTRRILPFFHTACLLYPVVSAITCLTLGLYGPSGQWCWLERGELRIYLFYIPVWIVILYVLCVMVCLSWKIIEVRFKLSRAAVQHRASLCAVLQVMCYSGMFILMWLPGSANRIANWVSGVYSYPISLLHAVCVPAIGMGNFVVLIAPGLYRKWKLGGQVRSLHLGNMDKTVSSNAGHSHTNVHGRATLCAQCASLAAGVDKVGIDVGGLGSASDTARGGLKGPNSSLMSIGDKKLSRTKSAISMESTGRGSTMHGPPHHHHMTNGKIATLAPRGVQENDDSMSMMV